MSFKSIEIADRVDTIAAEISKLKTDGCGNFIDPRDNVRYAALNAEWATLSAVVNHQFELAFFRPLAGIAA